MAVMRHSIIFGGVDSADYGIYIGGEGVFNAPQRDVEMIEIPGRNGAFALDRGRFKNIEVTYTAINHEPDLATFSANLEAFRNALASQKGYQRLTDTFHPDEYRMAAFVNGLEIEPIEYNTAAEFEVTFDCKPQRFLTSGETEISVSSGDTLTNPTLFESSPLLEVEGYGLIDFNGYEIELQNVLLGAIEVAPINRHAPLGVNERTYTLTSTFDRALVNTGDLITLDGVSYSGDTGISSACAYVRFEYDRTSYYIDDEAITESRSGEIGYTSAWSDPVRSRVEDLCIFAGIHAGEYSDDPQVITVGIPLSKSGSVTATYPIRRSGGTSTGQSFEIKVDISFDYDGDHTISTTYTSTIVSDPFNLIRGVSQRYGSFELSNAVADSSVSMLGNPTYIDCDLGEAYKIVSGEQYSLNAYIDLGSKLPVLSVGNSVITFDNTFTSLKIVPRWWKV